MKKTILRKFLSMALVLVFVMTLSFGFLNSSAKAASSYDIFDDPGGSNSIVGSGDGFEDFTEDFFEDFFDDFFDDLDLSGSGGSAESGSCAAKSSGSPFRRRPEAVCGQAGNGGGRIH